MRLRRLHSLAFIVVFAAGYLLVALDHFAGIDPSPQITENRYKAKMPSLSSVGSLSEFRGQFENYARDHLGFRNFFIRTNSLLGLEVLKKSKLDSGEASVYVGKDDWMFFGYTMRDYMGLRLTEGQLNWWERAFQERTKMLESHGARYLFYPAPVKVSIYPEHLPNSVRRGPGALTHDLLAARVGSGDTWKMLDLRDSMMEAKDWHLLYWKTDHHWNSVGAAVGAKDVLDKAREWFPAIPPFDPTSLECIEEPTKGSTSLSQLLGVADRYRETEHALVNAQWESIEIKRSTHEETGDRIYVNPALPDGLRVVCIGDSFHFELLRYYPHVFGYIRWVSHLGTDYATADLESIIAEEKPDLVLEERAEWGLLEVPSM